MPANVRILRQERRPLDGSLSRDDSVKGVASPSIGKRRANDAVKRRFAEPQTDRLLQLGHNLDRWYALAFHGAPRNTGDIDILVRAAARTAPIWKLLA